MMKSIGCNRPLYMLSFDHRGSFKTKMIGCLSTLPNPVRRDRRVSLHLSAVEAGHM